VTTARKVLPQILQPPPAAAVAGLLLEAGHVAELPFRRVAGFLDREPVGDLFRGALFEMETHLLGHLGLGPPPVEEVAQEAGDTVEGLHGGERRFAGGDRLD